MTKIRVVTKIVLMGEDDTATDVFVGLFNEYGYPIAIPDDMWMADGDVEAIDLPLAYPLHPLERMTFVQAMAYIQDDPSHWIKRVGWEWACIQWRDKMGPYRGDTFNRPMRDYFDRDDWLAEDWIKCDQWGKAL